MAADTAKAMMEPDSAMQDDMPRSAPEPSPLIISHVEANFLIVSGTVVPHLQFTHVKPAMFEQDLLLRRAAAQR